MPAFKHTLPLSSFRQVQQIKSEKKDTLFLSAGDFYQGSLWYTEFKEKIVSEVVPNMGYDAISLGNHEFDDGVAGLYGFVNTMDARGVPVLACNLDLSAVPELKRIKKSKVVTVGGMRVGLIGYLTPDTTFLSSPDKTVKFLDEIEEIRKEATSLQERGVKILIAVGHSGYAKDQEIAQAIPELDIVVGGHTNTFLWSKSAGPPPSKEVPLGEYPTVISHRSSKTLVVQAFAYGKYIGRLDVKFDENGDIKEYSGKPLLMDENVPEGEAESFFYCV